jgi:hypothetical protein
MSEYIAMSKSELNGVAMSEEFNNHTEVNEEPTMHTKTFHGLAGFESEESSQSEQESSHDGQRADVIPSRWCG